MIFEQLKEMIVKELKVPADKVTKEARLTEDLGADSMDGITLVMGIEEQFNISISDEEASELRTVGDLLKLIEKNQK